MAVTKYKIEKGKLAVYVDPTNASTFAVANMKLVAAATGYDLSVEVDDQELTFLGSDAPDWSSAQPTRKGWTIDCNSLRLRADDTDGTIEVDDASAIVAHDSTGLEIGDQVWVALTDDLTTVGHKFRYGRAFVKSIRESGTGGENFTYAIQLKGQGELLTHEIAA